MRHGWVLFIMMSTTFLIAYPLLCRMRRLPCRTETDAAPSSQDSTRNFKAPIESYRFSETLMKLSFHADSIVRKRQESEGIHPWCSHDDVPTTKMHCARVGSSKLSSFSNKLESIIHIPGTARLTSWRFLMQQQEQAKAHHHKPREARAAGRNPCATCAATLQLQTPPMASAALRGHHHNGHRDLLTVVRNPYSRLIREFSRQSRGSANDCNAENLNLWVQKALARMSRGGCALRRSDCRIRPQMEYFKQPNREEASQQLFVMAMESLSDDLEVLNSMTGSSMVFVPSHNGNCSLNATHLDEKSVAGIQKAYAEDFEFLGYDLEPPSFHIPPQLRCCEL